MVFNARIDTLLTFFLRKNIVLAKACAPMSKIQSLLKLYIDTEQLIFDVFIPSYVLEHACHDTFGSCDLTNLEKWPTFCSLLKQMRYTEKISGVEDNPDNFTKLNSKELTCY